MRDKVPPSEVRKALVDRWGLDARSAKELDSLSPEALALIVGGDAIGGRSRRRASSGE